jgi:hypothetical protein
MEVCVAPITLLLICLISALAVTASDETGARNMGRSTRGGSGAGEGGVGTSAGAAGRGSGAGDLKSAERSKLEAAYETIFPGAGGKAKRDAAAFTPPPGRLGHIGGTGKRERAFVKWLRERVPSEAASAGTGDLDGGRGGGGGEDAEHVGVGVPFIGPLEVRSIWGRGRGVVTTRNVTRGETLMEIPLMKCLSTVGPGRHCSLHVIQCVFNPRCLSWIASYDATQTNLSPRHTTRFEPSFLELDSIIRRDSDSALATSYSAF